MGAWAKLSLEPPVPEDSEYFFNLNPVAGGVLHVTPENLNSYNLKLPQ
jgi:hypothetical protein